MKANLLFTQFVVASILFGIGAENDSPILVFAGIIFLVLSIILAIITFDKKHAA